MKKIFSIILVLVMVFSISACTSNESTSNNESSNGGTNTGEENKGETKEVVELKVLGFKTATEAIVIDQLIEEFNEANSDIHVTYEGVTSAGGYDNVLNTRLISGQGDDIFFAGTKDIKKLQQAGYCEDLSDLSVTKNFAVDMTINGEVPGLAMETAAMGMYANEDLLDSLGLEIPQTYDEFIEVCEKVKEAGKTPIVAGAQNGFGGAVFATPVGMSKIYFDSDDPNEDIEKINTGEILLGDVLKPGFEFLELIRDNEYINAEEALVTDPMTGGLAKFAEGNTAFFMMGNWAITAIRETMPDTKISFNGIPVLEDGPVVLTASGVRLCVNKSTEHKEEAKKFVEFMLQTENNDRYVEGQAAFTVLKDGKVNDDPMMSKISELVSSGRAFPWGDSNLDVVNAWILSQNYSSNIYAGATAEETAEKLNNEVNSITQLQ